MESWKKHLYCSIVLMLIGVSIPISGIIFALILNTELTFDYISRYLFFLGPFMLFGVIDITYALNHKNDEYYFPGGIMIINRKNLDSLKEEGIIKGSGSENDPYKMKEDFDGIPRLSIIKMDSFFLIQQLHIKWLSIRKCKNIIVNQCKLDTIYIKYSSNLIIINNFINNFRMTQSWGNFVNENQFPVQYQKLINTKRSSSFPFEEIIEVIVTSIGSIFLGYVSVLTLFFYIFFIPFLLFFTGWTMAMVKLIKNYKAFKYSRKIPNIFTDNTLI